MNVLDRPIPLELLGQYQLEESFAPTGDITNLNEDVPMGSLRRVSDLHVPHYLFLIEEKGYKWHVFKSDKQIEIVYFKELNEDVGKALALRGRALGFEGPPLSINEHMHLGAMFGLDSDYLSKFKARFSSILAEDEPAYECIVQISPKLCAEEIVELQVEELIEQRTFHTMQVLASNPLIKERLLKYLESENYNASIIREDAPSPFEKGINEIEFKGSPEWFRDKEELTLQRPGQQRYIPKEQPQVQYSTPPGGSEAYAQLFIDGISSQLPGEIDLTVDPRTGLYITRLDNQGRKPALVWVHKDGDISIFETEFRDFPDSLMKLISYFLDYGLEKVGSDMHGGSLWRLQSEETATGAV